METVYTYDFTTLEQVDAPLIITLVMLCTLPLPALTISHHISSSSLARQSMTLPHFLFSSSHEDWKGGQLSILGVAWLNPKSGIGDYAWNDVPKCTMGR
jgi:hypothetical protein